MLVTFVNLTQTGRKEYSWGVASILWACLWNILLVVVWESPAHAGWHHSWADGSGLHKKVNKPGEQSRVPP